jgi:hypothetical protein
MRRPVGPEAEVDGDRVENVAEHPREAEHTDGAALLERATGTREELPHVLGNRADRFPVLEMVFVLQAVDVRAIQAEDFQPLRRFL